MTATEKRNRTKTTNETTKITPNKIKNKIHDRKSIEDKTKNNSLCVLVCVCCCAFSSLSFFLFSFCFFFVFARSTNHIDWGVGKH